MAMIDISALPATQKLPVVSTVLSSFGDLAAKVEMTRFSRTLATLLANGVTLVGALSIVRDTMGNLYLAEKQPSGPSLNRGRVTPASEPAAISANGRSRNTWAVQ